MTEVSHADHLAKDLVGPPRSARLAALLFVIDCHKRSKAAPRQSRPENPERRSNEIRAKTSIP